MINILKKIYHKLSNFALVQWLGRLYLNGFFISNYLAYRRLKQVVKSNNKKKFPIVVVFLCQSTQMWWKINSIYERMKEDERFQIHMLVIPEISDSDKDASYRFFSSFDSGAIRCDEGGEYFDLKSLSPDYVFYQRPYDQYLPKCYQSGKVSAYAKICYCSYSFLLTCPGIINCMAKRFLRNVHIFLADTNYTCQYNRNRFRLSHADGSRKSLFVGYPIVEKIVKNNIEEPHDKPSVLWTPRWSTSMEIGGGNFFNYKDKVVDYVKKKEGIHLIFRPHPLTFFHFIETGEMTEEEADAYKQIYHNSADFELDENSNYFETFRKSDILISDISSMLFEWLVSGKPLIYCDTGAKLNDVMKYAIQGMYVTSSWEDVAQVLDNLLAGNDPLKEKREEICTELFGKNTGKITERCISCILDDFMEKRGDIG